MRDRTNLIQVKRKTVLYFLVILFALASVTPALAEYLGPNRTVTKTGTVCKINLLKCQYVPDKGDWRYKVVDNWSCSNESEPWSQYPSSEPRECYEGAEGEKYWEKVQSTKITTTTYEPATITGSLENCTLNNGWCITPPRLSLVAVEPLTDYSIIAIEGTLNGQIFTCVDSSCSMALPEGDNTLNYWALSSWGDSSEKGITQAKVDSQPPVLAGTVKGTAGANGWYVSPVSFDGSASDSTSGLASFACTLDGIPLGSCASISVTTEGPHTLVLTATDNAGNARTVEQNVSVDTKSPALNVSLNGVMGSNNWYNNAALHASANDPVPGSGVSQFEYKIDNGNWQPFPLSGVLDLPDGKHSLDIRVLDAAGHSATSSKSFWLDSIAPNVLLDPKGTIGNNNWYITNIDLSASVEDATSGVELFEYMLNNSAWLPYAQPVKLSDGSHNISFWAQDTAGLVTQVNRTYQVDTRPPQIAGSISGTLGTNGWYISNVTVSASSSDPLPGSGIETFSYILNGASENPYTAALTIPDGMHTVKLTAKDYAGLTYAMQQSVKVDTVRPFLTVNTSLPNWIKGTVALTGTSTDNGSGISKVEISVNGGQTWQTVTGTTAWTYNWDTGTGANGPHTVLVRATDNAGLSTEQTIQVAVDNTAPGVDMPVSWFQWETVTLDVWDNESGLSEARVEISDPTGRWTKRVIDLNVDQFPLGFKWDRRFGDDTVAPHGTYEVKLIALDKLGNTTQSNASIKILIESLPAGPTATPQPYTRATFTPTPSYTATPTSLPTTTPTPAVSIFGNIDPTAQFTPTPTDPWIPREEPSQTTVIDWIESILNINTGSADHSTELDSGSNSADSSSPDFETSIFWGAAAAAIAGSVTGYILEEKSRREEEEEQERIERAILKAEKAEVEAKRHAQKMDKLETKWAQEAAWERARLESQKDFATRGTDAKVERMNVEEEAKWQIFISNTRRKEEERKKAEELKAGLAAYYAAMKQGEQEAAEPENWWDVTKAFISENIIDPIDEYVVEPIIEPALEVINDVVVEPFVNTIYEPYIAPVVEDAQESIADGFSWLQEAYVNNVAPYVNTATQDVVAAISWLSTTVYQPYLQPMVDDAIDTATDMIAWANENVYQPYLQPIFAAIGENIIDPYVLPLLETIGDGVVTAIAWLNSNIYEPIFAPVVNDIADWWSDNSDWVHGALDAVGFIPGAGEIADALNGLLYLAEGQYIEASVSLLAMIPVLGDLAKSGKWGLQIGSEVIEEAAEQLAQEIVEETAEQIAKETAEEIIEQVAQETAEEISEKVLKETVEELVSDVVAETVENTAQKVAAESVDDVVEQVAKNTVEDVASETAEQTSKEIAENLAQETVEKADAITADAISSLSTKFGNDAPALNKALALVEQYGDDALKALDAVNAEDAIKLLKNVDEEILGPVLQESSDAFAALARWGEEELQDYGQELAERAVKDAEVLKDVKSLIDLKPIDPANLTDAQQALIEKIAANSTFNVDADQIVLGKWAGLDGGFVETAKSTASTYYNPHPDVWNILSGLGKESREQAAWLINQQVIQTGVSKGLPFEYTLNGIENLNNEVNAIEAIFAGETEEVIKKELASDYLPFRIKELLELKSAGFEITFDNINNSYILIKP